MDKQTPHLEPTDLLRGEKVTIRPPRFEELSFVQELWADPETMAPVGGPHPFPMVEAQAWYARMVDPGDSSNGYCLIFNLEDMPVGEVSFHRWNQQERSAGLNIKIKASHRGSGYGSDALRSFLAWYFGAAEGNALTDSVAMGNQGGQRLLRSLGFQQDTGFSDVCMLVLTKEVYRMRCDGPGPAEVRADRIRH